MMFDEGKMKAIPKRKESLSQGNVFSMKETFQMIGISLKILLPFLGILFLTIFGISSFFVSVFT